MVAMVRTWFPRVAAVAIGVVLVLPSCGDEASSGPELPPAALEGRSVARDKGCASCHGSDGGGGVGPTFIDLFGSEVAVGIRTEGADGEVTSEQTVVTADRDYLVEAITDPSAKIVEGYSLPMPTTELTPAEVDSIITYIEALALTPTTDGAG